MKRRRNKKREKMIMLCSSAFVLTVLTLTGVYVKEKNQQIQEDYVVDLSLLEEKPIEEARESDRSEDLAEQKPVEEKKEESMPEAEETAPVTSKRVENEEELGERTLTLEDIVQGISETEEREVAVLPTEEAGEESRQEKTARFDNKEQLLWPVVGNILIDYSMEKPVYFASLQQYKCHPAIVIQSVEGQNITAAADGVITKIEKEDQLGNVITMDLGDGYEAKYGQLTNIQVKVGDFAEQGAYLADVAAPTKFYSVEGCNVYFALTKDGKPVNPMEQME